MRGEKRRADMKGQKSGIGCKVKNKVVPVLN
jgi:hypothetical protein